MVTQEPEAIIIHASAVTSPWNARFVGIATTPQWRSSFLRYHDRNEEPIENGPKRPDFAAPCLLSNWASLKGVCWFEYLAC
jgi:hypothetical protein